MQQIIIVEGIDMVGKTSIIEALSKTIDIPSFKQKYNDKWIDHTIDLLYGEEARLQMLEQIGCSVILDRGYPSEYAYGKAYERPIIETKIWNFDLRYNKLNALIVYLYKDQAKWQEDKTGLINFKMYQKIEYNYMKFFDMSCCRAIMIDTTNENLEEQLTTIQKYL